jgi:DNA-binding beta-propeller fold protein YncE
MKKTSVTGFNWMRMRSLVVSIALGIAATALVFVFQMRAESPNHAHPQAWQTATGQFITPLAITGTVQQFLNPGLPAYPDFVAGEAVRSQLSPDGKTLAILCAGQNSLDKPDGSTDTAASTQFIFLYDVSGTHKKSPVLMQVIQQTNSHVGLVFSPDGNTLYAAGGRDDKVYAYGKTITGWSLAGTVSLGHTVGIGVGVGANASGLGISADGKTLVVANNYNDSISVIDTATRTVRYEHDLRPFFTNNESVQGGVGGTFPFAVVVKGNKVAYVSSDRDREVIAIDISSPTAGQLVTRIKLEGNGLGMTYDASSARLFVAEDNADQVAVIDTNQNVLLTEIDARAPKGVLGGSGKDHDDFDDDGPGHGNGHKDKDDDDDGHGHGDKTAHYTGAATFAVTLSRDGRTLYAVNSGANSIAVIPLRGEDRYRVSGLIPTAYEPHDITFSADGTWMYIINGKSVTGPNPGHLTGSTGSLTSFTYPGGNAAAAVAARASNQYQFQLERASLISAPVPKDDDDLEHLTKIVATNNFYNSEMPGDRKVMDFVSGHIKHVIYIVKENRTFDQILGDLHNGSEGDPSLAIFGQSITPNFHALSKQFVTLDNFMDPGDGSMDGWAWSLQGRVTNTETITQQINYAFVNRGLSYESEGTNRNVPVNWGTVAQRDAVSGGAGSAYSTATAALPGGTLNVLTGTGNHASSDAPDGVQAGYIFNAVMNAGGTVRDYGFLVNNIGSIGTKANPVSNAFTQGVIQVAPLDPSLAPFTDVYYRGYDQNYPDLWRYNEWKREFDQFVVNGKLPSLSMVRVSHDHMGSFGSALGGLSTPEAQQGDDDLSVGLFVKAVAESRYAADTLFIITEDDCQDGPDHVDSHRSTTYVVGPYVKKSTVVSTRFSQVSVLRTIEDIFGTQHMNLNTAFQRPMVDVFDTHSNGQWSFVAVAPTALAGTGILGTINVPGLQLALGPIVKPKHDAAYWDKATAGFDFSDADRVPPDKFNRVLWKGMTDGKAYPALKGVRDSDGDDR